MDLIDVGLFAGYILIVLCTLAALIIPLVQSFGDPQSLTKSGLAVLGLVVIFLIGYLVADDSSPGATETTSKLVGGGIITMYVMFLVAIVGIIYTEISKILK